MAQLQPDLADLPVWSELPVDWSELQTDLLVLIGKHLNLIEDYLNFRTVCKSWHSAATKNNFNSNLPRVPWLMLAEEENETSDRVNGEGSSYRKFFSLYNGMMYGVYGVAYHCCRRW